MGQLEVYKWLKSKRDTKDNSYYSIGQVEKGLKEAGCTNGTLRTVPRCLIRLENYGFLETKMSGKIRDWKRLFRLKEEYCE